MTLKKFTLVILSVLLLASLGITSCKDNKNKSKEIRAQLTDYVTSLDSGLAYDGVSIEVIADFTDGLIQLDHDGNAVYALAESHEVSADGLTYTFKIRDAKWSNGDKVTANDFVFALRRVADPKNGAYCSPMLSESAGIKNAKDILAGKKDVSELGVRAVDDRTLVFELDAPCQFFLSLLAFPVFYPINEKFYKECGSRYATGYDTVLSCGAFVLDDDYSSSGASFSMSKNDKYWDAKNVAVEKITYKVIPDSEEALREYKNGALDLVSLSGDLIEQMAGDEGFMSCGSACLWYISLNIVRYTFLQNLNMRNALAAALDREGLCRNVVKDGIAAYFSVPSGLATGPTGNDFTKDCPKWEYGSLDDAKTYLQKAKAELGMQDFEISLIVADDPSAKNIASYIQSCWNQLDGVKCSVVVKPLDEMMTDLMNGDYMVCLSERDADHVDPMEYLEMFFSSSPENYGKWANDLYDSVIAACLQGDLSRDTNKYWMGLLKAEKMIMQNMAMIPVIQPCTAVLTALKGVDLHTVAVPRVFKHVSF